MSDNIEKDRYEIQLIVINEFGEFRGIKAQLGSDDCEKIVNKSKSFYLSGGFELTCEDGSYLILPPDLVQKSILKINRKLVKEEKNVQE